MNENLKKLTDQIKVDLSAKIADKSFSDILTKTKAAGDSDSGTFKVIISTSHMDRQGEIVDQNGWDLSFYKMNPVVLWGHDYSSLPIGVCTSIAVENGQLVAEGKFAPEDCNPFAQQVRRLYDSGMVKTTSVGFIPKQFDSNDSNRITRAELLEFSFVPVPANPYALTMRQVKELKLDTALLSTKGIATSVKEDAPADTTTPPADAPKPEEKPAEPAAPVEPVAPVTPPAEEKAAISKKHVEIVGAVCDSLEQTAKTLRELIAGFNDEKEVKADETVEVKDSGVGSGEVNDFLFARNLMKDLDNVLGAGLEKLNVRIRARGMITKK